MNILPLNREEFDRIMRRYPILETLLQAGVIGKKMCRELLEIDKWLMDDIHRDMLLAGMVQNTSSGYFKATEACIEYIRERKLQV